MQWAQRARCRLGGALSMLAVLATASAPLHAQRSTMDHWRVIESLLRDLGGIDKAPQGRADKIGALASQLRQRAQFYQDLAEYQAVLARDHAKLRDSIGKAGGASISATPYFRARALQELGQKSEAAGAYRAVGASSPPAIRALAAQWSATLSPGGPRSWQQDLVEWRAGQKKTTVKCPGDVAACALFKAIVEDDAPTIYRLQRTLVDSGQTPDYSIQLTEDKRPFKVDFFDPLVLSLLSAADYALAGHVLSAQTTADASAARGLALMRSGHVTDAIPLLRAGGANVAPFLGEALMRSGARADAEAQWKSATGGSLNLVWDMKGLLSPDPTGMARQFKSDSALGVSRYRMSTSGGSYLARALLRHQMPRQALSVIDAVVPEAAAVDVYGALPSDNVLLSRARYEVGSTEKLKDLFPLARGPIAKFASDYAVIQPTLALLQQLTQAPNIVEIRLR